MNTKRTLVSFMLIASVLLLASAVSAAYTIPGTEYSMNSVQVNGNTVTTASDLPTVNAGDTLSIQVNFKSLTVSDSIKVKATLEGNSNDVVATSSSFDVEANNSYVKTLTLKVPSDFESDSVDGRFPLNRTNR